ncbi:MAG TPA: FUSC family protein, partial [Neobacillus sp.]
MMIGKNGNRTNLHDWIARFTAADPGFVRLRFAANIVFTVFLACLVILIGLHLGSQTRLTPVMLTGLVALQANVLVGDSTVQAKKMTTSLFPLPCVLAVTVAAVSTMIGYHIADLILVVIVFITFFLQRFGVRHFALSMVGFLSFYFSLMYLQEVTFSLLIWCYAGIFVASASAYLVNFILFTEQPDKRMKRSLSSYHILANFALSQLMEFFREAKTNEKKRNRSISILGEYARTVISQCKDGDPSKIWPGISQKELSSYLFDLTLMIERLYRATERIQEIEVQITGNVRNILFEIAQSLKELKFLAKEQNAPIENLKNAVDRLSKELETLESLNLENPTFEKGLHFFRRLEQSTIKLLDEITVIQQKYMSSECNTPSYIESKEDQVTPKKKTMKIVPEKVSLAPSTKKGLQAALASAVAIVMGHLLSPSYPYWIALVVNMVILGTETTGRTVKKASDRLIGTITGAIVGVIAAPLVNGHPYVTGILLMISVFMAYYLMALSYSIFIFWITMLLTMAFQLMNVTSFEHALMLRVSDTVIGVLLGAFAATYIMPHRTVDKMKHLIDGYMKDVRELVDEHTNGSIHDPHILVNKAFLLDQKLHLIKIEAKMVEKWQRIMSPTDIGKNLHVLTVLNDYVKHLTSTRKHKYPE